MHYSTPPPPKEGRSESNKEGWCLEKYFTQDFRPKGPDKFLYIKLTINLGSGGVAPERKKAFIDLKKGMKNAILDNKNDYFSYENVIF